MNNANEHVERIQHAKGVKRIFCGYKKPLLVSIAHSLVDEFSTGTMIDMSQVTLVVAGRRAQRRLLELLVIQAERFRDGKGIVPPRILTRGELLEAFLPKIHNVASEIERYMAWAQAIRSISAGALADLLPSVSSEYLESIAPSLAKRVDSMYSALASANLSFRDVAVRGAELDGFFEESRWEALDELHRGYLRELEINNRVCKYERRRLALLEEGFSSSADSIYLCGLLELTAQQKQFLERHAGEVRSYILADAEDAPGFDEFGAVEDSYWSKCPIPLRHEDIDIVEHPRDVAHAALDWFLSIEQSGKSPDFAIGLGNERLGRFLKGRLNDLGVKASEAAGIAPLQSAFGFFLSSLRRYLESQSFEDISSLIRTPLMVAYLSEAIKLKKADMRALFEGIDSYQMLHLQASTRGPLPLQPKRSALGIKTVQTINDLLSPLVESSASPTEWGERIYDLLQKLSFGREVDHFDVVADVNNIIQELATCSIDGHLAGSEALSLFIEQFEKRAQIPDSKDSALEMLGWLEVAHDDSPALLLTGIEEGMVPSVVNSDPFLPDSLSRHLGLANNGSRYARDAALFSSLIRSKRDLRVVLSKRSLSGEVLQPSRLLLACESEQLPRRVDMLRGHGAQYIGGEVIATNPYSYEIAPPTPLREPIEKMSVTSFGSYLRCPYRFYLERVKRVQASQQGIVELDAFGFGNLAHDVLALAAKDTVRFNSDKPSTVQKLLLSTLESLAKQYFGVSPLPAVRIQIEHLRRRLERFVTEHVRHNNEGWETIAVEQELAVDTLVLELDGGSMMVTGRIDRIDRHRDSGKHLIIDYKTSEQGRKIQDVVKVLKGEERNSDEAEWRDLQAPLYVHAGEKMYPEATEVVFGYINISSVASAGALCRIPMTPGQLAEGLRQAVEVATRVRDGVFWPPSKIYRSDAQQDQYWRLLAGLTPGDLREAQETIDG